MSDYYQQESQFGFRTEGITHVVHRLIMANVLVFICQLLLDIPFGDIEVMNVPASQPILEWVAFMPANILIGIAWTPITYMFLHGSLMHVFGNMLMLYFFGPRVERVLGSRQFLRFYLLCGALGVMANFIPIVTPGWNPNILVIGASGATLGVLVAFAMIEPDRRIFMFPIPIPITSKTLVMIIIAMNLMTAAGGGSATSVATHFGGMSVGYLYMKWRPRFMRMQWRRQQGRPEKPTQPTDNETIAKAVDNIFEFKNKNR
jgi:membrane associated rhomboid family serine protease